MTAASQTVSALTIGAAGALNLYDLYPLTVSGSASFASGSTLNITMSNIVTPITPDLLMTYGVGQQSGSFSNVYVNGVAMASPAETACPTAAARWKSSATGPSLWSWHRERGSWTPAAYWTRRRFPMPTAAAAFSGIGATPPSRSRSTARRRSARCCSAIPAAMSYDTTPRTAAR